MLVQKIPLKLESPQIQENLDFLDSLPPSVRVPALCIL